MKKHHDAPTKVSSLKVMAAIQSQDEKAAAAKRPTLTGVSSSSSSTKPTTQGNLLKGIVNCIGVARSGLRNDSNIT